MWKFRQYLVGVLQRDVSDDLFWQSYRACKIHFMCGKNCSSLFWMGFMSTHQADVETWLLDYLIEQGY